MSELRRGNACKERGGNTAAAMHRATRLVDGDNDREFGIVRRYDTHEPRHVAILRITSCFSVEFLGRAGLARDADAAKAGESAGTF